jgi:hypothetical protein
MKSRFVVLAFAVVIAVSVLTVAHTASAPPAHADDTPAADDTPITATSNHCNHEDLSDGSDSARQDPIWAPLLLDPATVLQGTVATPDQKFGTADESENDQAPSEVSEEDIPWNHYTHDKTQDVVPDPGYKHLLSSMAKPDGTTESHKQIEVEWEQASSMGDSQHWGAMPQFVWPTAGDRVWINGRWVFDCGHPGSLPAVVYDANGDGVYGLPAPFFSGDVLIAGLAVPYSGPASFENAILQADPELKFVDSDGNGVWNPGEPVVVDTNLDAVYDAGDGVAAGTAPALGTPLQTDTHLLLTEHASPVGDPAFVQYSTEIHPPRGFVTFHDHAVAGEVAGQHVVAWDHPRATDRGDGGDGDGSEAGIRADPRFVERSGGNG